MDLFIPCAPKDYNKLPYVIQCANKIKEIESVHVCTPDPIENYGLIGRLPVVCHLDRDVLDIQHNFRIRPNWIYQQLLKLLQNVTSDWYMVIDADLFINRTIPTWIDGSPVMLFGKDQYHEPYFKFNECILGYGKLYPISFLSECTIYSRALIREMLSDCSLTPTTFVDKCSEIVHDGCCIAESELYGSWVFNSHPNLYIEKTLKFAWAGRYNAQQYTNEEIEFQINSMRNADIDTFSLHSWEGSMG